MAKKKSAQRKTAKSGSKSAKKSAKTKKGTKNSLVGNINRRKKAGTSRKKKDSTISREAYSEMKKGWPKKNKRRK